MFLNCHLEKQPSCYLSTKAHNPIETGPMYKTLEQIFLDYLQTMLSISFHTVHADASKAVSASMLKLRPVLNDFGSAEK